MGDRAQVAINDGKRTSVYLYTHWNGSELAETVKRVLAKRRRWDDAEYLTRMIFCEMVRDYETEETGFGIGTSEHFDNDNPLILLNCAKQKVYIDDGPVLTFEQYVTMDACEHEWHRDSDDIEVCKRCGVERGDVEITGMMEG